MRPFKKIQLLLVLMLTVFSFQSRAQKAVLYNYDFRVPDGFRHEIQEYDEKGKKKYREAILSDPEYSSGKKVMVLNKYLEPVSQEEVETICQSAAEILKRKYGYSEVTMMYPNVLSITSDKVSGFPNKAFKNAVKKNAVDAYITMEFKMQNKALAKNTSLYWEEAGKERTISIGDVTLSYTIYNAQEGIISQNEVNLRDELQPLFSDNYNTEIVDDGFKIRKLYLTKEEILAIYKLAEKKLEAAE